MCGENTTGSSVSASSRGSPPRVRGKLKIGAESCKKRRITPACAGKTPANEGRTDNGKDHPRVCGENSCHSAARSPTVGSPPRVRGKLICTHGYHALQGITPACAGKTLKSFSLCALAEDHPRVCGENTSEMAYFRG